MHIIYPFFNHYLVSFPVSFFQVRLELRGTIFRVEILFCPFFMILQMPSTGLLHKISWLGGSMIAHRINVHTRQANSLGSSCHSMDHEPRENYQISANTDQTIWDPFKFTWKNYESGLYHRLAFESFGLSVM